MTRLHRYLARLYDTILSRQEIVIESIELFDRSDKAGQISEFYARLRSYDGSILQVVEKLTIERYVIIKSRYAYHYQQANGDTIFRYDNAPHYPEIETHPHHKHIGDLVVAAQPPDITEVLREIDDLLYPSTD